MLSDDIPRVKIILWLFLAPACLLLLLQIENDWGPLWSIHGFGGYLMFVFSFLLMGSMYQEARLMFAGVSTMKRFPRTRSPFNILIIGVGALYLCASVGFIVKMVLENT